MRLSNAQVRDVLEQIDGAAVVPSDNPVAHQLEMVFGPHTFFLGHDGLHVVERGDMPSPEGDAAFVVTVAGWADDKHTRLAPHRAEVAKAVDIGPATADLPTDSKSEDED
jgi:hypothetical protein